MEAPSRLHFGTLLRQFRLDAGMTQQTLAERAKLSVEAVSTLERGARTRPHRDTVVLLSRALELPPEREALLERAADVAHAPRLRERIDAVKPSVLRIVRPDTEVARRHNLPHQVTSFVGRQHEVDEIAELLREHRLVTVTGAGGVGKTRVAVKIGSDLLDGYPDGVWFVDLASLADQTLVAGTVLNAMQLPSSTGPASEIVVAYVKTRQLLLILDNCEHVIAEARELAAAIVRSCPAVRTLSTSREPLNVSGEQVYRLPSLAAPPDSSPTPRDALSYGAVALFVDRAFAVDASFALTDHNAPAICEICRRLDGIPLAVELAAARVNVLAPDQIAQRLDQRFRLLTGGGFRALPRHQTMTALIDWSYDLLTPREQRFFESLSVFAGGCTLEAATAVCATDDEDDIRVIDLVASLVAKSLLLAELAGSEQRYRLLESTRHYARDKLAARGEEGRLARRHALVYLEKAEQFERAWLLTPELPSLPRARLELENWRAALEWALAKRGDVILGQRLAALRKVMWLTFGLSEARRWVRAALESVDERTPLALLAGLDYAEAQGAALFLENEAALAAAERSSARYREVGDVLGLARAQSLAGASLALLGRPREAEPLLRDALEAAHTLGDRRLVGWVKHKIGWVRSNVGDFAGARAQFTEVLEFAKLIGDKFLWASVASDFAENEFRAGDAQIALRLAADVLATYRAMNSSEELGIAFVLTSITAYLIALGRYDEARVNANEALALARRLTTVVLVAFSLKHIALVALLRPPVEVRRAPADYARAARLFGFVEDRCRTLRTEEEYGLQQEYNSALGVLRMAIGGSELERLMASGASMTEDEAIAQAHALE